MSRAVTWQGGRRVVVSAPVEAISPRQARLALLSAGLLDQVQAMLAEDEAAVVSWEYAVEIRRDDPLIAHLASQIGMSAEDVDALFRRAAML